MYYKKHLFFCCNQKKDNITGCKIFGAEEAFEYAKKLLQDNQMWGEGLYRVSKSGCLGRCSSGPVCVVYPDGIWYSYVDLDDIKEIIMTHLINEDIIDRLRI
jgi:(2Fe-2S) ferredoxin